MFFFSFLRFLLALLRITNLVQIVLSPLENVGEPPVAPDLDRPPLVPGARGVHQVGTGPSETGCVDLHAVSQCWGFGCRGPMLSVNRY